MLIRDDEKSSTPVPVALFSVIVEQLLPLAKAQNAALTADQLLEVVQRFEHRHKDGLTEEEWNKFLAAHGHLFVPLGTSIGTVVDFGRVAETRLAGGAPVQLSRRKTIVEVVIEFLEGFVAGGLAGAVSKTVIAPGDRVKIIFQVDPTRQFSLQQALHVARNIVKEGGVLALWMGNGATMLRVVPYAAITFMSFEQYHSILRHAIVGSEHPIPGENQTMAVTCRFLSGALAGATSTACTYPLDLMRARVAAHAGGQYNKQYPSYLIAFQQVVKKEGWRSLYGGLLPTLVGIMPYAGSSFACFETIKHYLVHYQNLHSDKEIPAWQRLIAGGFSGLMAQSFTYPLDIVRRRMQVLPGRYRGITHALSEIYREEGVRKGLYKGLTMNWIKGPIAVATSFTINDIVKTRIRLYHKRADEAARQNQRGKTWFLETALCGAVAGGLAKLWTAPFDRIKIMYQVGLQAGDEMTFGRHARDVMKDLFHANPNMWQGSGAMMIRVVPYAALTYAGFEQFQPVSERLLYSHHPTFASNFLAAGAAATVATWLLYPLDLMRVKNATSAVRPFDSYFHGMRALVRARGIGALWENSAVALGGVVPLSGIAFATYEWLKERYDCDTFSKRLLAGSVAGSTAQLVTYPIHIIRRHAQVDSIIYEGFVRSVKTLYQNQGFYKGLYERMPFGWIMGATTVGISFSIFDLCRDSITRAKMEINAKTFTLPTFNTLLLPQPKKESFDM